MRSLSTFVCVALSLAGWSCGAGSGGAPRAPHRTAAASTTAAVDRRPARDGRDAGPAAELAAQAEGEAPLAEDHIGPECPWNAGDRVPRSLQPECPTWPEGDPDYPVMLVRPRDVVLTHGDATTTFARTFEGWHALHGALEPIGATPTSRATITTRTGSLGGVACAIWAAAAAGFRGGGRTRACTSTAGVVDPDGRVHPPPVEAVDVAWRNDYRLAGSCSLPAQRRCDEIYQSVDRLIENARETGRGWCREMVRGRWSHRECPTEARLGACEFRSEVYPRVEHRYESAGDTVQRFRDRCLGTFQPPAASP